MIVVRTPLLLRWWHLLIHVVRQRQRVLPNCRVLNAFVRLLRAPALLLVLRAQLITRLRVGYHPVPCTSLRLSSLISALRKNGVLGLIVLG